MSGGTLKVGSLQLGDSVTNTQNFFFKQNDDGTLSLWRGTPATPVSKVTDFDASGNVILKPAYLHVRDEKPSGTASGTPVVGMNIRTLNTVVTNNIVGAGLAANQITLPAGTYHIEAVSPVYVAGNHRAYLYNVTDGVAIALGNGAYGGSTYAVSNQSNVSQDFTISGTKVLELRHTIGIATATDGLGIKVSDGLTEVFASVQIWKKA